VKSIFRAALIAATIAASWLGPISGAQASQNSCIMPNTGTVSGLTLVNDANACINSLLTLYSGASAPGSPSTGMLWFNTTTNYIQQFDGTSWSNRWFVDATNHLTTGIIGGGAVSASLSAAATTDIGSVPQSFVTVNGATTITSFGTSAGVGSVHIIKFSGSLTLTYNATNMILPGATNIITQANDAAFALYLGGGNWWVLNYIPFNGGALINPAFPLGTVLFGDYAAVPAKFVYGAGQALTRASFPAYTAAVARAQSGTLTSGNATITSIANTAGFGVGMPVEGSSGINAGCTIASLVPNTSITLNSAGCVTASGSVTVTTFLTGYGSGGSGSTVGVKDCRGRVLAGRDDLGGTAASRLTAAGFGTGATVNNSSGSSNETTTLSLAQLPTGIMSVARDLSPVCSS